MFTPTITLNEQAFDLQTQRTNGSVRSVAARALEPLTLTISHEVAKNGRVSSVVYFDDSRNVPVGAGCTIPKQETIRLQLKLMHNPTAGRSDSAATIEALRLSLIEFATSANFAKLLNRES